MKTDDTFKTRLQFILTPNWYISYQNKRLKNSDFQKISALKTLSQYPDENANVFHILWVILKDTSLVLFDTQYRLRTEICSIGYRIYHYLNQVDLARLCSVNPRALIFE